MARISPLKVRVFGTCRLRYCYQYIDRVPARLRPGDTAGSLVHRVLCDFFSKVRKEERTRDRLLAIFEEGWNALSRRYLRMPGAEQLHEAAQAQLETFAQRHGLQAEPLMVEPYFQVEIEPNMTLFGRVDRIDEEPDGSLHIIDYKTGEQPADVDAAQLRLYAIMVEEKLQRPVSRLSFWYLDDGHVWTMDLTEEQKRGARQDLLNAVHQMESETEFSPTIAPHCAHCPYFYACAHRDEIEARRQSEGW